MYDTCELAARFVSCRLTLHGPKCLLKSLNLAFVRFLSFHMSPRAGTRRDEGLLLLRFQPSIVRKGSCVVNFCFWFLSPCLETWKAWTCYPRSLHQIDFDSRVGWEAGMETWILQVGPAFVAAKICGDLQYFFLLGSIVNESMQPTSTLYAKEVAVIAWKRGAALVHSLCVGLMESLLLRGSWLLSCCSRLL